MECLLAYKQFGYSGGYFCHGSLDVQIAPHPLHYCRCDLDSRDFHLGTGMQAKRPESSRFEKTSAMHVVGKVSSHLRLGRQKPPLGVEEPQNDNSRKPSKLQKPISRSKKRKTAGLCLREPEKGKIDPELVVEDFKFEPWHARLMSPAVLAGCSIDRPEMVQGSRLRVQLSDSNTREVRECDHGLTLLPLASSTSHGDDPTYSRTPVQPSCRPYDDARMSQTGWERVLSGPRLALVAFHQDADQLHCSNRPQSTLAQFDTVTDHSDRPDEVPYRDTSPFRTGKRSAFRDNDWTKADEEDLPNLLASYSSDASPAESAVGFAEQYIGRYNGKGKGRDDPNKSNNPYFGKLRTKLEDRSKDQPHIQNQGDDVFGFSSPSDERASKLLKESWKLIRNIRRLEVEIDRNLALQLQEQFDKQREEEERLAAELAEAVRIGDCIVCGDSKSVDEFPIEATTSSCDHSVNVCSECLRSWMASEFETKGVSGISCPECLEALTYSDVQRAASLETFAAYDEVATREALAKLPGFEWCLGANCGSGQLNYETGHLPSFMRCASCGYSQCLKHRTKWHDNETCEQYDYRTSRQRRRDEEAKTEAMLDDISKMCPGPPGKTCGWRIQKTDGCDHMTCKKCRHQWCWRCLASMDEIRRIGNTAHQPVCKYHSHNLDIAWPFNVH